MKILFIAPHLSTGGMPQYLYKQIEALNTDHEVWCAEWENVTGGVLVVQRNRILNLLKDRLITIGEKKENILSLITKINPDIIHLQEIPEMFMGYSIAEKIYNDPAREYTIIETSHDSSFDISNKLHFPDRFAMVSQYQVETYQPLGIPCDLVEYPIEYHKRTKTREELLNELGLDPNKKHVITVGLFTPRKNQAEVIEYAKQLQNYPIQFHFVGNQADNFKYYWEPLMQDFPSNCKWWGERSDVDTFYQMADLFLFTSRGHSTDKETMPLVIRESISWQVPSLIYNLDVYLNYFNKHKNIEYLNFNNKEENIKSILNKLKMQINKIDDVFEISITPAENKINIQYKKHEPVVYKVSIKEKYSNAPLYWFNAGFENYSSWWVVPIPTQASDFSKDYAIGTILVEFYDSNNNLVFSKDLFIKDSDQDKIPLNLDNPFDCLFNNYNEMFLEKKYDCYKLEDLDLVLDIGANSGLFSLLCADKGVKKVYAFEPNKESLINLNSVTNNLNVEIIDKAVYTKDEDLKFYIDPTNTTIGSLSKEHLQIHSNSLEEVIVPAISLKTFIKQNKIDKISLVKMDIEGAEYEIIDGLEDEVFNIIDGFLIEYHDNDNQKVEKLINKLISKGFDIDQIRDQNSKNNDSIKDSYATATLGTIYAKKSTEEKLLTVIIPTYNHEKYIEECVDSVLKQKTLFNFNILISDDCSTDNTWNILQKYKNNKNITLNKNEVNQGSTPLMVSKLLKKVKSEYITILDGDDFYIDDYKLQKQINFLQSNPEYSVHSTSHFKKETDDPEEEYTTWNCYGAKSEVDLLDNLEINYMSFGFMFKNIFKQENYSFPEWFFHEDIFDGYWALHCLLLELGKGRNDRWAGGVYRITPNGAYGEKDENWKMEVGLKQSKIIKNAYKDLIDLKDKIKPIIIIDAFFHDKECFTTFKKTLANLKNTNIPIMLVTNSNFSESLIKEVDYILYDKNNRLFKNEYVSDDTIFVWYTDSSKYFSFSNSVTQKHGLSVLSNLHHSTNLAKSLGFTHFFRIEYDSEIKNIDKIKHIMYEIKDKNGYIYVNEDKYLSYQLWYLSLDYFTRIMPNINKEEDYINSKLKLGSKENEFILVEDYLLRLFRSDEGYKDLIVNTPKQVKIDFPGSSWNTITSAAESDFIVDGFVSSVYKVAYSKEGVEDQYCPIDNTKFAVVTWNCSSTNHNKSKIFIKRKNQADQTIDHFISGNNGHFYDMFDLTDEDVEIEIIMNDHKSKIYTVNKNNIESLQTIITLK
jgi:FkbM family methyltransferase